jgi:antibiotic biosynthesis monooxygenase (ABM) superfamily enzyme
MGNLGKSPTLNTHRPRKATVISAHFIFKPATYDDEFHRLDAEIEAYVATIPGFLGVEKWVSFDGQTKNSPEFSKFERVQISRWTQPGTSRR